MPTPPERTPPRPGSAARDEDATVPPPASASDTTAHAPQSARERLPAQLPAPFGRYRLLKLLGEGGMGRVYLAHDSQLDRPVALKVPLFSPEDGPALLERFYREARAAATILHANVCPVYDVGEVGGVPYLTMAFIEGKPLGELAAQRPLTPRQAASLVRKLALALAEAHKRGVIHRDLKPSNVMVNRQGEPVVMDFGLARRARGGDPRLTRQGAFLGTPAYAPPEQVSGEADQMGPACDVYSLGVILYESLAGRLPFEGDVLLMISRVLLEEPPPPSQFRPGLDPALEAICLKAMAKKPADRYRSMATFAGALQDYLRGQTTAAEPAPAPIPATEAIVLEAPADRPGDTGGPRFGKGLRDGPPTRKPAAPTEVLPPRPRRKPRRRRGVAVWGWVAGGAGLALPAVAVLGAVLWRATNYGTVHVEPSEPGAAAELKVDGEVRNWHEPLRLRPGEHELEAAGPGYRAVRESFVVRRGDNQRRRVRLQRQTKAQGGDTNRVGPGDLGGQGPEGGAALNALTAQEKAAGWKLLFDGRTTAGWHGYNRGTVPDRWRIEDGALTLLPGGEPRIDLVTEGEYDDFELAFEWKVTPGGNSGVLYRVAEGRAPAYTSGPEYQILDNAGNRDGPKRETSAASCYGLYGPARDLTRPVGEWNRGRIVADGNRVEHWLNGEKVVEYELGSADWRRRVGGTRFKGLPGYGKAPKGRIALIDQGSGVAYRNLKLRPLP